MREVRHSLCSAKLIAVVLVALVAVLALGGVARAGGSGASVTYQVDVAHDGVQVDPALQLPFARRWTVNFPDTVSYPLIAEGKVFVTVSGYPTFRGTTLYALDQKNGQVLWSQPIFSNYTWSAAAYDSGRVFVVDSDGGLHAFAAGDGTPVWSEQLPRQYSFSAPPTAADGVVYVAGSGWAGTIYAVDEGDGHVIASQAIVSGDDSSPTLSDSSVFVSEGCNQTYAFARTTLAPLWHDEGPCGGGVGATTVYAAGRLLTRDFWGNLILDASTGLPLGSYGWRFDTSQAVVGDTMWGLTAVDSTGSVLVARDVPSGTTRWSFSGDGGLYGAPILIDNGSTRVLVVLSTSGTIYGVDAATGAVAWTAGGRPYAESYVGGPTSGLGAGQGLLVIPVFNQLSAYANDNTAPTLTVPNAIAAPASSSSGAAVSFSVSATDPDDEATVSCTPTSGSIFPVGITTVSCTATDTAGNTTRASFPVVVSALGAVCDLSRYPLQKGARVLKNANLNGCYLPAANLSNATATNANFSGAYVDGATLTGANLSQASFAAAVLTSANLTGANLTGATLRGANLTGATLTGVTWSGTTCPDGTTSNANGGTCSGHLG
jgi:outer membrane protein assembly factor BamB